MISRIFFALLVGAPLVSLPIFPVQAETPVLKASDYEGPLDLFSKGILESDLPEVRSLGVRRSYPATTLMVTGIVFKGVGAASVVFCLAGALPVCFAAGGGIAAGVIMDEIGGRGNRVVSLEIQNDRAAQDNLIKVTKFKAEDAFYLAGLIADRENLPNNLSNDVNEENCPPLEPWTSVTGERERGFDPLTLACRLHQTGFDTEKTKIKIINPLLAKEGVKWTRHLVDCVPAAWGGVVFLKEFVGAGGRITLQFLTSLALETGIGSPLWAPVATRAIKHSFLDLDSVDVDLWLDQPDESSRPFFAKIQNIHRGDAYYLMGLLRDWEDLQELYN